MFHSGPYGLCNGLWKAFLEAISACCWILQWGFGVESESVCSGFERVRGDPDEFTIVFPSVLWSIFFCLRIHLSLPLCVPPGGGRAIFAVWGCTLHRPCDESLFYLLVTVSGLGWGCQWPRSAPAASRLPTERREERGERERERERDSERARERERERARERKREREREREKERKRERERGGRGRTIANDDFERAQSRGIEERARRQKQPPRRRLLWKKAYPSK